MLAVVLSVLVGRVAATGGDGSCWSFLENQVPVRCAVLRCAAQHGTAPALGCASHSCACCLVRATPSHFGDHGNRLAGPHLQLSPAPCLQVGSMTTQLSLVILALVSGILYMPLGGVGSTLLQVGRCLAAGSAGCRAPVLAASELLAGAVRRAAGLCGCCVRLGGGHAGWYAVVWQG